MAVERKWLAVGPYAVTAPGTVDGQLTLASALGLKVKMRIQLNDPVLSTLGLEIKRVLDNTHIEVGPPGNISLRTDVSSYGGASRVFAPEQTRPDIPLQEIERYVYEEEPTIATRVVLVDQFGNPYTASGGSGGSIVKIQDGSTSNLLEVFPDGSIKTVQLFNEPYDSIGVTYPFTNTEVYQSYLGGLSGTLQQTVTVVYTDSTKATLTSVVRT